MSVSSAPPLWSKLAFAAAAFSTSDSLDEAHQEDASPLSFDAETGKTLLEAEHQRVYFSSSSDGEFNRGIACCTRDGRPF